MNRHCIPGLTMSKKPRRGTSLQDKPGNNCVPMATGLARTRIALCQRPGADTEETDVMI